MSNTESTEIGRYLLRQLEATGLSHMFGVPGDFVLSFMDLVLRESKIKLVTTCNELNAGYAADAYARLRGIGAVCVTYNVGGLSLLNAIAGAWVERVPLIVISGAPPRSERSRALVMHHTDGNLELQFEVFRSSCVTAERLLDPGEAARQIDHAIAQALAHKRPAYLELPSNLVLEPIVVASAHGAQSEPVRDHRTARAAAAHTAQLAAQAKAPVFLVGHEVARFDAIDEFMRLANLSGWSYATTMAAKGLVPENHPAYLGTYAGDLFCTCARKVLETSDFVLQLGFRFSDIEAMNRPNHELPGAQASEGLVRADCAHFSPVSLKAYLAHLIEELTAKDLPRTPSRSPCDRADECPWARNGRHTAMLGSLDSDANEPIALATVFELLRDFVDERTLLVTDTGDALLSAVDLPVRTPGNFIAQGLYLSIGYSVPATLGASLARPEERVVTLVGDGAFQMTCQEISTLLRHRLSPIVLLLNNGGYAIERALHPGPFNDIQPWKYHALPEIFGDGAICTQVHTKRDLMTALERARGRHDRLSFIEVMLAPDDVSRAIRRIQPLTNHNGEGE